MGSGASNFPTIFANREGDSSSVNDFSLRITYAGLMLHCSLFTGIRFQLLLRFTKKLACPNVPLLKMVTNPERYPFPWAQCFEIDHIFLHSSRSTNSAVDENEDDVHLQVYFVLREHIFLENYMHPAGLSLFSFWCVLCIKCSQC